MKKNQKYTQEEMYLAIELWKESGLPMLAEEFMLRSWRSFPEAV